ncbi:EpsG family protein [[Erwinia] mediterraneensis]|uniref:EpsG family protein n=1 Tax=[Erwinia] mediterraneensis TaxID=2161819 RepID=UPI00103232C8|nr:EpsG family protein [[Erwinia] mediterraneensis]
MTPYWYISGFILLISLVEVLVKKDDRTTNLLTFIFMIAVLTLIVFGGIRGLGTGMDDYQYRSFYQEFLARIQVNGFWGAVSFFRYEPVIFLMATITSVISHNSDVFIFVFAIISVSINAVFFKKMSPYPVLALALYSAHIYINKDMNQIRFGLSSALFLGVLYFVWLKRYWLAFGFLVVSFWSHNTAVIAVSLLPFLYIRESRYIPALIILFSIPLSKFGGNNFVLLISSHLGTLGERAAGYSSDSSYSTDGSIFSVSNLKNVMLVFMFCYFMLSDEIKQKSYDLYRLNYLLILTFAIGGAVRIFFYNYPSGARLSNYMLQVEPVILTMLIGQSKPILKPAMFAMFAFFVAYYLYYNTISLKQAVVGYEVATSFRLFP